MTELSLDPLSDEEPQSPEGLQEMPDAAASLAPPEQYTQELILGALASMDLSSAEDEAEGQPFDLSFDQAFEQPSFAEDLSLPEPDFSRFAPETIQESLETPPKDPAEEEHCLGEFSLGESDYLGDSLEPISEQDEDDGTESHEPLLPQDTAAFPRRIAFARYSFEDNLVEATIHCTQNGLPTIASVANGSLSGFYVATKSPFKLNSKLLVELSMMGCYQQTFDAEVVRVDNDGMAIHLLADDNTWRFRSAFLDLATERTNLPPSIDLRLKEPHKQPVEPKENLKDLGPLWQLWQSAQDSREDEIHQEFIHAAMQRQRLEFALERYRELAEKEDGQELSETYLGQIGTILSFYGLAASERNTANQTNYKKAWALFGIVFTFAGLVFMGKFMGDRANEAMAAQKAPFEQPASSSETIQASPENSSTGFSPAKR